MKNEIQDDGYETCGGDILTPNSHSNLQLTPQNHHYLVHQPARSVDNNILMAKHNNTSSLHDDPYNFVDDETNTGAGNMDHNHYHNHIEQRQDDKRMLSHDLNNMYNHHIPHETYAPSSTMPSHVEAIVQKKRGRKKKNDTDVKQDINLCKVIKERKKHDKFNGMSEDEVSKRTLPDHLANNLDIIIVSQDRLFKFVLSLRNI